MLDVNDLMAIEEQLQSMEETTKGINNLMESIEEDISESTQRLRQEIISNRTMLLSVIDKILFNLDELKKELQEG